MNGWTDASPRNPRAPISRPTAQSGTRSESVCSRVWYTHAAAAGREPFPPHTAFVETIRSESVVAYVYRRAIGIDL